MPASCAAGCGVTVPRSASGLTNRKLVSVLDNAVVEGYLERFRSEAGEKVRTEVGKDDGVVIDRLFT
jgi:hypothetical protein